MRLIGIHLIQMLIQYTNETYKMVKPSETVLEFNPSKINSIETLGKNKIAEFLYDFEKIVFHLENQSNMVDKYNIGSGYIIQENVENRTATTKEFLMSDDTIMVQQFVEPVHYLENGKYEDIDNSLVEGDKGDKKVYKNNANSFKVAFDQEQSSSVEIEEDGYILQFELKGKTNETSKIKVKNSKRKEQERAEGKENTRPGINKEANGQITYTGFVTSIGYGGTAENASVTPLLQYSYYGDSYGSSGVINSNQLYSKTYANGNVEEYTYSTVSSGNKTQVDHKNSIGGSTIGSYIYNYNSNGAMTSQRYLANGLTKLTYDYGALDNLEQQTLTISGLEFHFEYTNNYDTFNDRIKSSQIYSLTGCTTADMKTLQYTYNTKGEVSEIGYDSGTIEYEYDAMGRLSKRSIPISYYNTNPINENYTYKTYGGYTTNLLTCIDDQTDENNDRTATYDENGYVTSVSYNGKTYTYTYDRVGRLSSETVNGTTKEYSYDANNVQKTGLTYTNGQLTSVNGAQIVYDAMGNPTTYKGNAFTWEQGRKLVSGSINGKGFTYNYDGNGMRYEKVVNGTKTNYYYNGTQLLMESKNGSRTWYIYGVTGIEGMIVESGWQDSIYYFDKNTLGDIVAIRDESGNIVARYEYDAWGNCTVMNAYGTVNTSASFIGNSNPFRYRGYYYDTETGFYYLQTRYYDPTICRFINADNYELVAELSYVPGELNMYAYCGNNPIMYTDETGELAISAGLYFGGMALFFLLELLYIETTTHAISNSIVYITQQVYDAVSSLGSNIYEKKKSKKGKNRIADPHARPNQHGQGKELKSGARKRDDFQQRNGKRRGPQPLKKHTPGRGHRKQFLVLLFGSELILDDWGLD